MAQTPTQSLSARPTSLAIVGSYLGRARFGAALIRLSSLNVTGIVDSDLRAGRALARELPSKPSVYDTVSKLLAAQPNLDGVVVASALPERATTIETLVSTGISVLSEFPYTKLLPEMDRLTAIAEKSCSRIFPALTHRYDSALRELDIILAKNTIGLINRMRCEVNFPLTAAFALENGVVPVSIDWYDLLQVVACRTTDLCQRWLGRPDSINADIDLPHHAALVGRRAADPVANLIVLHDRGQSTHLLKLSRSVQPTERYLLYGDRGSIEYVRFEGEKLAAGPTVRLHLNDSRPEPIYKGEDYASEAVTASANLLTDFVDKVIPGSSPSVASQEARTALETVQASFASARDGIRMPLPLVELVDVDKILEAGG